MCQSVEGMTPEATPTPDVEFHDEDYPYGYFDKHQRTETMLSDEVRPEVGPGDLVTKLDSLDDFFDEPSSPQTDEDGRSSRTITEFSPDSFEAGTQLYDEQILPILHQASNNTSFQNGFADRSPTMSREGSTVAMNPAAFSLGAQPRPTLHSRSITSPSAPAGFQNQIGGDLGSDDGYMSGGFSDADDDNQNAGHMDRAFFLENMINQPGPTQHPAPGLRRLTSRSRDERYRERPPPGARVPNNLFPRNPAHYGDML
jgi:hypothetical protein